MHDVQVDFDAEWWIYKYQPELLLDREQNSVSLPYFLLLRNILYTVQSSSIRRSYQFSIPSPKCLSNKFPFPSTAFVVAVIA